MNPHEVAAAKAALEVQDACNLSGVVRIFDQVLQTHLWPASNSQGKGTQWVNEHPVSKLFADKISSLARFVEADYQSLFKEVKTMAETKEEA